MFAILCLSIIGLVSLMGGDKCSAATSASLSLSNPSMTSTAITPGSTATVSTNVTVSVDNAESYSLSLKVDNANITNGSTTITAGNVVSDNTWGYKWDNASTYTAPSTSGTTLTNSTLVPLDSNGAVSFTKDLTFGAKFSASAEAGHYRGSGVLSLVATPKKATFGGISKMQEMTLNICSAATIGDEATLIDTRDSNTYQIRKHEDGKCWMTSNLKIVNKTISSSDSDMTSGSFTIPASSTSGFSSDTASNAYVSGNTGYYTWCAATAGTCSSATSGGQNASNSICPKGWKLPTGMVTGANTTNDFYNLFKNMGLTISGSLATSGNTSWGSGDLTKVQGSPYNFAYTGYMESSDLQNASSRGYWWSRTAGSGTLAYVLRIYSSSVYPGTNNLSRYLGYAVRCVARYTSEAQSSSPK